MGTQTLSNIVINVLTTKEWTQKKIPILITISAQTKHMPPYTPLIMEVIIQVLNKKLEEQHKTLTQYKKHVVLQKDDQ